MNPRARRACAEEGDELLFARDVIALYDGKGEEDLTDIQQPVWSMLQMPLNHLGLRVHSHDIRDGPPPEAWLKQARAVVTWFRSGFECPAWLWPWLEKQVPAHALRVVHFQDFGCLAHTAADRTRLDAWLRRFGMAWRDEFVGRRMRIETKLLSEASCALEADPRRYAVHQGPTTTTAANQIWVETRDRSNPDDVRTPVVTGTWGGVALAPWTVLPGGQAGTRRWHLDPFLFFRTALAMDGVPAPHPSVLNGRRMFVLHVDGDGFESVSTARLNTPAAKVFLDEILDVYKLPATVSIIVGSLTRDFDIAQPTDAMKLAAEILNRPYVEAGSHGVLHPYQWSAAWAPGRPPVATLPYKQMANYDYSPVAEVRDSIRFINERLLEDGKRCRIMQWTGDCIPPAEAILECARHDAVNINGGTFRWDEVHNSVGYVSPWVRALGDAVQVCAGAANENEFPGYFTTNPGSYGHIDTTIERTGQKRILKPANVYVHFYSAETRPRLDTLKRLLDRWARRERTAPVYASTYVTSVLGARSATIRRTSDGWAVRDMGACRTLRIDEEDRGVDFTRSSGVIGARRIGPSLYIHLDASEASVVLAASPPASPHLVEANHAVSRVKLTPRSITLVSETLVERVLVLGGFPAEQTVHLTIGGKREDQKADGTGRVEVRLPPGADVRIEATGP
jgi:hypothetical protein